ncbi:MAG: MBG domain-containing protein, partial [Proteobacteria bacterium]|nr:MBG domain-containing protein [Pseudomonadota bacterium]
MNHTYRLVFNAGIGACGAAPESARGRGKRGGAKPLATALAAAFARNAQALPTRMRRYREAGRRLLCFALILSLAFPSSVFALPTGGQVVAGNVATTVGGAQMTLNQASRAAVMNWREFNIAPNETLRIRQSGADAAMLARVTGGNPSELLGRLQADGKLFLINPKGILVGAGAVIDTGSFLASTLDVADADFLKGGALTFKGDSGAGIVNLGNIMAREGNVLLFAHTVKNAGEIAAPKGTVGFGAGSEIFLASPDDTTFTVKLNLPANVEKTGAEKTGIDNTGTIAAAQAELKAAGGSIYDLAVNQSGLVRASGVEQRPDGRVILTADGGTVSVTGNISARKANGSGGEILVGGDYQGKNPAVANATRTYVGPQAKLDASATAPTGDGGKIVVWADSATSFTGSIEAKAGTQGGNGGMAEVSGKHALNFTGTSDLSAPAGKVGTLLLDPDDITVVAGTTNPLPTGLQNNTTWTFGENNDFAQTLGATTLAGLLLGNDVTLQATNTLTVNAPITLGTGGSASATLTLQSKAIAVNQNISLANASSGTLRFFANGAGSSLTSASGATISAPQVRVYNFSSVTLNGPVSTTSLHYNMLPSSATAFTASHASNSIADLVLVDDDANPNPVSFSGNVAVNSSSAMAVSALISAANNVTLSSGGNLTLRGVNGLIAASAITASGTTQLAATGSGVLINQASTGLLAGTGRRLLYTSATTGSFTLGGLSGYTQYDGVAFPNDPQGGATRALYNANSAATSTPAPAPTPTLTIAADDFTKLYGQPDPTFTASYSGGTSANLTTLPSFSILQGAHVNVGNYAIVPSGAASNSYSLSYVNGTLRIDPATLTYTANSFSRTYGVSNPAFGGSMTGFVLGDTLASATSGTLAFNSEATTASNVGSYAINGSGLTANNGNYVFAQAAGNATALTINPATLTYTASPTSRVYGASNPAFGGSLTGFVLTDTLAKATTGTLAFNSPATTASNVGSYAVNGAGISANHGNYVFAQA